MSINKYRGSAGIIFTPVCDICGDELLGFESFQEAVQAKKAAGLRSRKNDNGEWEDVCQDCQREEEEI